MTSFRRLSCSALQRLSHVPGQHADAQFKPTETSGVLTGEKRCGVMLELSEKRALLVQEPMKLRGLPFHRQCGKTGGIRRACLPQSVVQCRPYLFIRLDEFFEDHPQDMSGAPTVSRSGE